MTKAPMYRLLSEHCISLAGKDYHLKEIEESELELLRMSDESGIIMTQKKDGKRTIWYALIEKNNIKLISEKWLVHQCCTERECCTRLSAAKDPEGCACIRDEPISEYISEGYSRKKAYKLSFRIEKYDFIDCAIQTFGMKDNGYKILSCENCYYVRNSKNVTEHEVRQKVLSLAQFLNPGLTSYEELEESLRKKVLPEVSD